MDSDNFEFKPLTEGLGFDKKTNLTSTPVKKAAAKTEPIKKTLTEELSLDLTKDTKAPAPVEAPSLFDKPLDWNSTPPKTSRTIAEMLNSLPPSIDFFDEEKAVKQKQEAKVYKPVGRVEYTQNLPEIQEPQSVVPDFIPENEQKVDVTLNNTLEKAFPKVGFRRPFFHQSVEVQPQFTEVTTSFTSAVLDAMVITGLTSILLVGLILLTGIDLLAVVMHSKANATTWAELGAIYFGVYLLYYMCTRGFWGSTLGDWAFDIQLGQAQDQRQWYYPYQVIWRMTVIAFTGFITLPILSLIMRKDVAASFSKLRLYTKNY